MLQAQGLHRVAPGCGPDAKGPRCAPDAKGTPCSSTEVEHATKKEERLINCRLIMISRCSNKKHRGWGGECCASLKEQVQW